LQTPQNQKQLVYHYTTLKTALEKILPSLTIRLGPLTTVNDPWETQHWDLGFESASGYEEERTAEITRERIEALMENLKLQAKVLCTTHDKRPDEDVTADGQFPSNPKGYDFHRGYARSRMWAQYADKHQGVCLVFIRERISTAIVKHFPDRRVYCDDVVYDNYLAFIDDAFSFNCDEAKEQGIEQAVSFHVDEFHRGLFFMKTEDWRDEAECRWVVIDENETPRFISFGDALVGIIVGADFQNSYLPSLFRLVDDNVDLKRIVWTSGHPILIPIERQS
jgi:hypothetical protein